MSDRIVFSNERWGRVVELHESGMPIKEVAKTLGISYWRVSKEAERRNYSPRQLERKKRRLLKPEIVVRNLAVDLGSHYEVRREGYPPILLCKCHAHLVWDMAIRPGCAGVSVWSKVNEYQRLHNVILPVPTGYFVDHINRNPLDNRCCNLRQVTPQQNIWNSRPDASGIRDLSNDVSGRMKRPRSRPFQAVIRADGKEKRLGSFATREEATAVYQQEVKRLRGEFAPLELISH